MTSIPALPARWRDPRVGLAAAAVLLFLLWALVWWPTQQNLHKTERLLQQQRADYQWMQQAAARIRPARSTGNGHAAVAGTLLTLVEQSASTFKLRDELQRVEPQGPGRVQLWFNQAPFDRLLGWWGALGEQGVAVTQINVRRAEQPGHVSAQMSLQATAP